MPQSRTEALMTCLKMLGIVGFTLKQASFLDNPKIALRVKELQSQAADLSLYTVKSAFDELEEARSDAKKAKKTRRRR